MGKTKNQIQWWDKREVKAAKGFLDLLIAYIFASMAIDSGSWWHYLFALVFGVLGTHYLIRAIRNR